MLPEALPAEKAEFCETLRAEVRGFVREELGRHSPAERARSWIAFDPEFSRKVGERGWIGRNFPVEFGGAGGSLLDRYVITEELLAAGAPVGAHWIADRQSGPQILKFGTLEQRQRYLPAICRGESYFCIGMSEPNSGSDLASISTRVERTASGWLLNGSKIWSSFAHRCHYMIALVRSQSGSSSRHAGLSQFIIDLSLPGVTVRPIRDLTGGEHFNEVFFDNVALEEDALLGRDGAGWDQVTAELAFERSGPERYLSSMTLLEALIDKIGPQADRLQATEAGRLVARLSALRSLSVGVTGMLAKGENASWMASCMKDVGTTFEQETVERASKVVDIEPRVASMDSYSEVLGYLTQVAPSFSLRGGTREIMRGIIVRGLGLR